MYNVYDFYLICKCCVFCIFFRKVYDRIKIYNELVREKLLWLYFIIKYDILFGVMLW